MGHTHESGLASARSHYSHSPNLDIRPILSQAIDPLPLLIFQRKMEDSRPKSSRPSSVPKSINQLAPAHIDRGYIEMHSTHSTPQPQRGSTSKPKAYDVSGVLVLGEMTIPPGRIKRIPAKTPPNRRQKVVQILRLALDIARLIDMVGRWLEYWSAYFRRRLGASEI